MNTFQHCTKSICFTLFALLLSFSTLVLADYIQDAQSALEKKEYSSAVIHLKNHLKSNPKDASARYLLGTTYLKIGEIDYADKELKKAFTISPQNEDYIFSYIELLLLRKEFDSILEAIKLPLTGKAESKRLAYIGYAYLGLDQKTKAAQFLNQSNQIEKNILAINGLAKLAIINKDNTKASDYVSQSLSLKAENKEALKIQATLADVDNDHEKALDIYNTLIKNNPEDYSFKMERAAELIVLKQPKQAKEELQVVLKKSPEHPRANFLLAQILLNESDFKGAQAAAQKTIKYLPHHQSATLILGASNFALQNYNQAYEYLYTYLNAFPDDLQARNLFAKLYLAMNEPENAINVLVRIFEDERNKSADILFTLARAYLAVGKNKEAIELLNRAQVIAPDNIDIKMQLVSAQFEQGDVNKAISELVKISQSPLATQETDFLLIMTSIKQGQFNKAESLISQRLKERPDDVTLLNLKALLALTQGNIVDAESQYLSVLNAHKDNYTALIGLARLQLKKRDFSSAERYYKQVIKLYPQASKAYIALAGLAEKQGDLDSAELYLLTSFNNASGNLMSQASLAEIISKWYLKHGKKNKLLKFAEKWSADHPKNDQLLSFLAKVQIANQRNTEAEATLRKIIFNNQKDVKHRLILANLLSAEPGNFDEVINIFDRAIDSQRENMDIYMTKTAFLIKSGKFNQALAVAETVERQFPGKAIGKIIKADVYRSQKQFEKSLELYRTAYKQEPGNKILLGIADSLIQLRKNDDAITTLLDIIKIEPENIQALFKLGKLYQDKGNNKKASQYYELLLKISPNNIIVLNNLALVYLAQNDPKAVKVAELAYQKASHIGAIVDTYGFVLLQSGNYEEGLKALEKASSMMPENYDVKYHLALAYNKNKQAQKAIDMLKAITQSEQAFLERDKAVALLKQLSQ